MGDEQWKWIDGYQGVYEVSNHGRVRRHYTSRAKSPTRVLSCNPNAHGYPSVSLCLANKSWSTRVHRLVAAAFLPRIEGCSAINHKDGNKTNNHASNLEWCTIAQNNRHAKENGLFKPPSGDRHAWRLHPELVRRGERVSNHKLKEVDIKYIRKSSERHVDLARKFGISKMYVWKIKARRAWSHV